MMSPQFTPNMRLAMVIVLLMVVQVSYAQHFPRVASILDNPDGTYAVTLDNYTGSLQSIAEAIQPKKNKRKETTDHTTLEMSFRVFQRAAVGNRPFGKIRYKILLQESNGLITCTFTDFNFKKYERSARYGRMMEVKGRGQQISSLEESLNEVQWGTVRWKMEQEVGKYHNKFLAFEPLEDHSDTTQQDR
jgi:hypothetical protein